LTEKNHVTHWKLKSIQRPFSARSDIN